MFLWFLFALLPVPQALDELPLSSPPFSALLLPIWGLSWTRRRRGRRMICGGGVCVSTAFSRGTLVTSILKKRALITIQVPKIHVHVTIMQTPVSLLCVQQASGHISHLFTSIWLASFFFHNNFIFKEVLTFNSHKLDNFSLLFQFLYSSTTRRRILNDKQKVA